MAEIDGLTFGLGGLARLSTARSRSISAENPDGSVAGGARETPTPDNAAARLGVGWKVRPCITLEAGSTTTLADVEGPGTVSHVWMTVDAVAYRNCILRIYWDGEDSPSVEAPLGDFFAAGHALRYNVSSLPVAVTPTGGFNCYWPMPFRRRFRMTIENQWTQAIPGFFYQVNYALQEVPEDAAYFHAQWRRGTTRRANPEHVVLDGVRGRGHFVGTFIAWRQFSDGWWGEGEVKFFLDGDGEFPTICTTGTEDYFGGAWCFQDTFSAPFCGYPLWRREPGDVPKHAMYRWHIPDPIRFERDLRVTIQALGWWPDGKYEPLEDDIASTAYWYQAEPHGAFPAIPGVEDRWPR